MAVTLSLDDALLAAAKQLAARRETSVTAIVRSALEHQVALEAVAAGNPCAGVMQELIDYSMGRTPRGVVLTRLGLEHYGSLAELLNAARLPHPLVALSIRQQMVKAMVELVQAAGAAP